MKPAARFDKHHTDDPPQQPRARSLAWAETIGFTIDVTLDLAKWIADGVTGQWWRVKR